MALIYYDFRINNKNKIILTFTDKECYFLKNFKCCQRIENMQKTAAKQAEAVEKIPKIDLFFFYLRSSQVKMI